MTEIHLPNVGITMGDPTGIGPEIIVKVLSNKSTFRFCRPIVLGDGKILERTIRLLNSTLKVNEMRTIEEEEYKNGMLNLINLSHITIDEIAYGAPTEDCSRAMVRYVEEAVKFIFAGKIDAITTAPISKKALSDAGYSYPGHTDFSH